MKKKTVLILVLGAVAAASCGTLPQIGIGSPPIESELGLQEIKPEPTAATIPAGSYFRDELEDDINQNWGLRVISGLESQLMWAQNNGKFRIQTLPPNDTNFAFINKTNTYRDVIVQAEVENNGPTHNSFSLICRASPAGWYEFRISSDGFYELLRFDQYRKDEGKRAYTNFQEKRFNSTKIKGGLDKNVFAISCVGDQISAFINGEQLYWNKRPLAIEDNTYSEGAIGFGLLGYGDSLDVNYNWVEAIKP